MPCTNLLIGSLTSGLWSFFCSISNSIMVEIGFTDQFTGCISMIVIFVGTPYACYITCLMRDRKSIDNSMKFMCLLLLLCWSAIAFMKLYYKDVPNLNQNTLFTTGLILFYLAFGITSLSYQSLLMNSCCIITKPISETITIGNMYFYSCITAIIPQEIYGYSESSGFYTIIGLQVLLLIIH